MALFGPSQKWASGIRGMKYAFGYKDRMSGIKACLGQGVADQVSLFV